MTNRLLGDRAFVGRTEELAVSASAAQVVAGGRARVLHIQGEAGAGKTALVREVVDALPPSFTVLRAEADETGGDEPLALLSQVGPIDASEGFAAGIELLGVLNNFQQTGPVALVVEDLHWADAQSRLALLTASRRLGEDRVLVIATTRPHQGDDDGWQRLYQDPDRCQRIILGGLGTEDVALLADRAGLTLGHEEAERLRVHTAGHPLHVRTLLAELTPDQLAASDVALPAPRSLASTTMARLSELPPDARALVSALAVANGRVPLLTAARIAGIEEPNQALEELLATGFVKWHPNDPEALVEFSHPLYRAAVYDDLAPTLRQRLHRGAADVVDGGAAFEHRVAATDGVDDALADELEAAARRENANGRPAVAARLLSWASSMSSQRSEQERRLLGGVRLLLADGQTPRAERFRHRVEACGDGPLRSLLLGELAWNQDDPQSAERWLLAVDGPDSAADAQAEVLASALARLSTIYATQSRAEEAVAAATRALELDDSERVTRLAWISLAFGETMLRGAPAGVERLTTRLSAPADEVASSDADLLVTRGSLLLYEGRFEAAIADLRAAIRLAARGTRVVQLPRAHLHLSQLLFSSGDWDEGLVHAHVCLSLVSDQALAWMETHVHAVLGEYEASRGDPDAALRHLAAAREASKDRHVPEGLAMLRVAEGALARAKDEPAGVVEALGPLARDAESPGGRRISSLAWWPALVTASIDCGDVEGAASSLDSLERISRARRLDLGARIGWLRARLALAKGDPDAATAGFEGALALLTPNDPLLDRALLLHDFGRLLLARGIRREALDKLRRAHELLVAAGAAPYRVRVEADLEACGIRQNGDKDRSPLALTDRERDVAVLVSKGMTNREVAAQLYVSEKSVEFHLRNIYGKLGITSRRELRSTAFN